MDFFHIQLYSIMERRMARDKNAHTQRMNEMKRIQYMLYVRREILDMGGDATIIHTMEFSRSFRFIQWHG